MPKANFSQGTSSSLGTITYTYVTGANHLPDSGDWFAYAITPSHDDHAFSAPKVSSNASTKYEAYMQAKDSGNSHLIERGTIQIEIKEKALGGLSFKGYSCPITGPGAPVVVAITVGSTAIPTVSGETYYLDVAG